MKLQEKQKLSVFSVRELRHYFILARILFWPACATETISSPHCLGCAEKIIQSHVIFTGFFTYRYSQNPKKLIGSILIGPKLRSSLYLVSNWLLISSPLMVLILCFLTHVFANQESPAMPGVILELMVINGPYLLCIFCVTPSLLRCQVLWKETLSRLPWANVYKTPD